MAAQIHLGFMGIDPWMSNNGTLPDRTSLRACSYLYIAFNASDKLSKAFKWI